MKKDLVTLMDENRCSLGKTRASRLMTLVPEDKPTPGRTEMVVEEDENHALDEPEGDL